jgi:hypothetical protein
MSLCNTAQVAHMSEINHTPTPWAVGGMNDRMIVRKVPDLADGYDHYSIAVMTAHSLVTDSEAKANADLIVQAVNERPTFLTQLAAARSALEQAARDAKRLSRELQQGNSKRYASEVLDGLAANCTTALSTLAQKSVTFATNSAPTRNTSHNSGERLPKGDPASVGAETTLAQEPAGQSEAKPIAWQWRYAGDAEWHTPSGGQKLSDNVLQRERPIEQRPLYAHPTVRVNGDVGDKAINEYAVMIDQYLRTGETEAVRQLEIKAGHGTHADGGYTLPWIGEQVEGEKLAELYAMPAATYVLLDDPSADVCQWIKDEVLPTFNQQLEAYPGAVIGPAKVLRDPYSAKPYVLFYVTAPAIRALPLTPEGRS